MDQCLNTSRSCFQNNVLTFTTIRTWRTISFGTARRQKKKQIAKIPHVGLRGNNANSRSLCKSRELTNVFKLFIVPMKARGTSVFPQQLGFRTLGSRKVPGQVPNHGFREGSGAGSERQVREASGAGSEPRSEPRVPEVLLNFRKRAYGL